MSLIHPVVIPSSFISKTNRHYTLAIYRGDLEHADAPGNKWHKLQHHLTQAKKRKAKVIATFGGPFSNHLHAFAKTLESTPFQAIAVVRGELQPTLTPTLIDAVASGVELWPSSRSDYRSGCSSAVVDDINRCYGDVYWIPEGGGGLLGAFGCRDWAGNISYLDSEYDAWAVSAGTGTTAAGLLSHEQTPHLHVFSALKGAEQQKLEIVELAHSLVADGSSIEQVSAKLSFYADCHEGGYAKQSKALMDFMADFAIANPEQALDPVYTSKSLFAICKAMQAGRWPHERTLFIHTGGLQGWRGYPPSNNPFSSYCKLSLDGEA
ncbi:1-aminocyclopropane-1-carboxylate deaminase/D-cysteine desulfhydrase [Marinomonas transparens]|uniref:Cysteine desulfhydrase n=1 Tax=Marinomonas transparens TaxID=2795388 RepID=A0A934JVP7_9GAMM|nr:cysteine desulfhydrase [Marinomonas transparens]MBJ7538160.1 cysteine desulfhydrase [Marinomonas transparens]